MAVLEVFSDNLDPAQPNLSARFTNGVAFFINAPLIEPELEIDVYLQVYFPSVTGELVRNLPFTKTIEGSTLLNVTDTESLVTIPSEYLDTGLEMALLFLASDNTYLDVFVVTKGEQQETDFSELLEQLDLVFTTLQAILALLGVPVPPILPPGVPTTAQQNLFDFFFLE